MSVKDFVVTPCDRQEIKEFIEHWHYSNNVNGVNSPYCFKLLDKGDLIGAMMYGWISMAGVWKKYVSEEKHLIELRILEKSNWFIQHLQNLLVITNLQLLMNQLKKVQVRKQLLQQNLRKK